MTATNAASTNAASTNATASGAAAPLASLVQPASAASSAGYGDRVTAFLARRPVWQVSYLAALAASVVVEIYGLIARAAGVPMRAASIGAHTAGPITVGMFAMGVMVVIFWFTFVTVLIARFAKDPARIYLRVTLPLLVLSLAMPLSSADTATSTKIVLVAGHLMAGAIIIPVVTRRLRG